MTLPWTDSTVAAPAGNADRFGSRWRLVGAGLSNVWRYGDLDLPAPSGRLLLRGPNGTGKTTALEALWPYLLDLNPTLLSAGKARTTSLSGLMREGADGRRRVGYLWVSFAGPGDETIVSYGVRLSFSEGGSPPVTLVSFTVPGLPLHSFALWGPGRIPLTVEQFTDTINAAGGTVFGNEEQYVRDLATRVFAAEPRELGQLAARIRHVRNPALLGEVSPRVAAEALRESLPGVAEDVIEATGDALAESDATRKAFKRDRAAAGILDDFARVWTGHTLDVTVSARDRAAEAMDDVRRRSRERDRLNRDHAIAVDAAETTEAEHQHLMAEQDATRGQLEAIERSDDYRDAGRLAELTETVDALSGRAKADWSALVGAATRGAKLIASAHQRTVELDADIVAALYAAETVDSSATAEPQPLRWELRDRPAIQIGDRRVEPGPALLATCDVEALDKTATRLTGQATTHANEANTAKLYVKAHEEVATAQAAAEKARSEAARLVAAAEEHAKIVKDRARQAQAEASVLRDQIGQWLHRTGATPGWTNDDIAVVEWADPPAALAGADELANATTEWAHQRAATARASADDLGRRAAELRTEAAALRGEANQIRSQDLLLPLPRPGWAGPGEDTRAFGAAVDWVEGVPAETQDIVEATLATAGVLGATITADGAATATWAVTIDGPEVESNLAALLRADPDHPHAATATAVLRRVALVPHAGDLTNNPGALVIGTDGTFRAGVLAAVVPEAREPERRRAAHHVGALRRRDAALVHAADLERQAGDLDGRAGDLDGQAVRARTEAEQVLEKLGLFPKREPLRATESARTAAADAARAADDAAAEAERAADEQESAARASWRRWVDGVTAVGLPGDVEQLIMRVAAAESAARTLYDTARALTTRLRPRLVSLERDVAGLDTDADLAGLGDQARNSQAEADTAQAKHEELTSQRGASAEHAVARHRFLKSHLSDLGVTIRTAAQASTDAVAAAAGLEARLSEADVRVLEAGPLAVRAIANLRDLLAVPGVTEAVLGSDPDPDNHRLVAEVAAACSGKPTSARRTVRERADTTRAALAGVWSLDPGSDHPELDTYVLTHGGTTFTPTGAAAHARRLAERAEEALRAKDEVALRDFVVGRLPLAVATAWTRLRDWGVEVNNKMRSAAASSGVGVAVRISVRDDLPAATRTVYELACKSGDALRVPEAKAEAGQALQQLIDASDGDDMTARVRAAVDVRDWVDVTYQVTRPGEPPRTWGSRTGLSGGERRLVVLAPMLAAIAAAYDQFPPTAARLAALDEVPSEVDEAGRDGLARYIAELDLDLIATSHHWDGAPGAWDGIDAHDLEAGPDGTVVAFPMLVRGPVLLPGDTFGVDGLPAV